MRKSGPRPSQKEVYKKLDGIREASSEGGEAPPKEQLEEGLWSIVQHAGGPGPPRIGTLRGASRDNAGVLT